MNHEAYEELKCIFCGKPGNEEHECLKKRGEKMETKKGEKKMKAVLVTTQYRGVFYGEMESGKDLPGKIVLKNARNCIYWSSDCNGFLGLAANGPTKGCKIGAKIEEVTLYGITSVSPVSAEAVKKWEGA